MLTVLRAIFEKHLSCRVRAAPSGPAALVAIEQHVPDILVLDLHLGGMDGFEVIERIRAQDHLKDLPILILSAGGDVESVVRAFDLGADDYVAKPFNVRLLVARLRALLRVKGLLDALTEAKEVLERELDLARTVQRSLLPPETWERTGLRVISRFEPCRTLSGDFLEVVELDQGATGVFLGDVTGHGVSAALFSTFLKAHLLRPETRAEASPAALLEDLNESFRATFGNSGYLLSAVYMVFPADESRVRWARAGHPYPILLDDQGRCSFLEDGGILLGLTARPGYRDLERSFAHGERLVLYTDGLTEQAGPDGVERFETDRVRSILSEHHTESSTDLVERLLATQRSFAGRKHRDDDVTVLVVERTA